MFKPYKGICTGKPGKIEGCQNQGIIMTNSRKLCQSCEAKRKKRPQMVKVSDKKKLSIKASENYYRIAIAAHIAQNKGKCPCEECGINIENPTGMNVSHILPGSGRTKSLYLHPDNHKILCKVGDNKDNWGHSCHNVWEVGARDAMKIYEECLQIKEQLLATLIADI